MNARRHARLGLAGLVLAIAAAARPGYEHARAAASLVRLSDPNAHGLAADIGKRSITVEDLKLDAPSGRVPARLYAPAGDAAPPALVLVHGVHRLGIDEPRLTRLARTMAGSGLAVLTPEIRELADFVIDPRSIATIGYALRDLRARLRMERGRPGLLGVSFGGGLALVAAADPRFADDVGFVGSIGAHHDLTRVLRFFATGEIARPDGSTLARTPHEYGPLVVVYGHAEAFFEADDVPIARDALRLWLWEQFDAARARASALSPASRARMDTLFGHDLAALRPLLEREIARTAESARVVSPSAHLARIRAPIFALHGAGDAVIPSTEALWIAHDAPPGLLRGALVTRAIGHAELDGQPTYGEQWALVRFLTLLYAAADEARAP